MEYKIEMATERNVEEILNIYVVESVLCMIKIGIVMKKIKINIH